MNWLKQSTAASCIVGPILDSAGAEYAGAVIGDLSISKNGGTLTAMASAATLTHVANGQYTLALTTGNTDTLGRAEISCNKSTYQMPQKCFVVLHANVFDVLFGTTAPSTLAGVAQTGDAYAIAASGTHGNAALKTLVDDVPTNSELTTALASADDATLAAIAAIPSAPSAAAVSAQVAADLATAHGAGSWATATGFAVAGNAMTLTSGERTAVANEVEAQIIDETDSEKVLTAITDKIAAVNPSMAGLTAGVIASAVRTNLATELARIDEAISSRSTYAGADTSGTTTLLARVTGAVMLAGNYTAPPTVAQVRAEMDSNSTRLADIVADTNELQTDWVNGGRLDLILDTAAAGGGVTAEAVADEIETRDLSVGEFAAGAIAQLAAVATINVETPTVNGTALTLRRGDDYLTAEGRQLRFTNSAGSWPDLTGATFVLQFRRSNQTVEATTSNVVTPSGANQRVDIEMASAVSGLLIGSPWAWSLIATLDGGSVATLTGGSAQVS